MDMQVYQDASKSLCAESQRLWHLVHSLKETGLNDPESWAIGELSSYDQHPADNGSETFEREKDLGLLRGTYEQLEQVNHAWERLESGSYGTCEECGWPIGEERLQAMPAATLCIKCKQSREHREDSHDRPIEEDVLFPPFGRTFGAGKNGFDGEDTWQALASYGTANSPQDIPGAIEYDDTYVNADEDEGIVERTDAIIDLDYRRVADQREIYPDLQGNPRRLPHELDMNMPGENDIEEKIDWYPAEASFTSFAGVPDGPEPDGMDADLWNFIRDEFAGDPEMEMAAELTTEDMEELAKEFDEAMRWEREH